MYEDNFLSTSIETIACGTQIVSYRTGGSVETGDEKSGIVADDGNSYDLLKLTNTIFSEKECRNRSEKFTPVTTHKEYEGLFSEGKNLGIQ